MSLKKNTLKKYQRAWKWIRTSENGTHAVSVYTYLRIWDNNDFPAGIDVF